MITLFDSGECTPRTELRVPTPDTYDFLFELALQSGRAWPWGSRPVSIETFAETLWQGVLTNCVIFSRSEGTPFAYVSFDRANLIHGTAYLNAYVEEAHRLRGFPFEAILLLVDRLFERAPIRKLYLESVGETFAKYSSPDIVRVEARFEKHFRVGNDFDDLVVSAVHLDDWLEIRSTIQEDVLKRHHS